MKTHVASKNHKQKKELQENKVKIDTERKSRKHKIRYLGIQEDMLKA